MDGPLAAPADVGLRYPADSNQPFPVTIEKSANLRFGSTAVTPGPNRAINRLNAPLRMRCSH